MESFSTKLSVPVICYEIPEMQEIQQGLGKLENLKKNLITSIMKKSKSKSLKADKLLSEIFSIVPPIPFSDLLLTKTKLRVDLGNPPGKSGSYCDAIIWETLINEVPDDQDLYFISQDTDYVSILDNDIFSNYLMDEWMLKKKSIIIFYKLLTEFININFPETEITSLEIEEEQKIAERLTRVDLSRTIILPLDDKHLAAHILQKLLDEDVHLLIVLGDDDLSNIAIKCANKRAQVVVAGFERKVCWIRGRTILEKEIKQIATGRKNISNENLSNVVAFSVSLDHKVADIVYTNDEINFLRMETAFLKAGKR